MTATTKLRVLDLFSGIGGFSLGLEATGGFETVAFCEIEKYPQKVLAKHWPGVPIYDDVRELTAERLATDGIGVDVITGGFPCQDISNAGKGAGIGEGTRSGLWSEIARLVGELRPRYVIVENVTALLSGDSGRWFGRVLGDLAALGYDAEWHCIPASELGAHHHRDRVWVVAYGQGNGWNQGATDSTGRSERMGERAKQGLGDGGRSVADASGGRCRASKNGEIQFERGAETIGPSQNVPNTVSKRRQGQGEPINPCHQAPRITGEATQLINGSFRHKWGAEPGVGRVANGIPNRAHRLKGLGNAVVPQIPELIGRAILEAIQ